MLKNPTRILVIGLGVGVLVKELNKNLPTTKVDVVEINPLMLSFAKEYFNFIPNNNTKIYINDAYDFVMSGESFHCDAIYADAYAGENIPQKMSNKEFIAKLADKLNIGGVVIVNFYNYNNNLHIIENHKQYFKRIHEKVINYNKIMFFSNLE